MSIKRLVQLIIGLMLIFSTSLAYMVYNMVKNQHKLLDAYQSRYTSFLLASQLRQSSDDLTRFARAYAATSDPRFENYFNDVLAIRNGDKARPEHYERIYWDLVVAGEGPPFLPLRAVSLYQLMVEAGFSESELATLQRAEASSNLLVEQEKQAMNAVKGVFADEFGRFTRTGEPDTQMALDILFSADYHRQKAIIMRPMNEFIRLLDKRTSAQITDLSNRNELLFTLLEFMAIFLLAGSIFLTLALVRLVLKPLGGEPKDMQLIAEKVASGELDVEMPQTSNPSGVYKALLSMTSVLRTNQKISEKHNWLQQGLVMVSETLQDSFEQRLLAQKILRLLCDYLKAPTGAVYLLREETDSAEFYMESAHALSEIGFHNRTFRFGEGLLGQAAQDNRVSVIKEVPRRYLRIRSATGLMEPACLVIVPFASQNKVLGVLEFGFFEDVDQNQLAFLEAVRQSIGTALANLFSKAQLQQALQIEEGLSAELKSQQLKLQESNATLQEKSIDLEQQAVSLARSQQELEAKAQQLSEASNFKSEFLANISHEVRTPLNSMLILARSLANNDSGKMDKEDSNAAKVIAESGNHLLQLINDVLDLAKVEAGQMLISQGKIDSGALIISLQNRFLPISSDKGLTLQLVKESSFPDYFVSDRLRVEQILTNLLGNALKFTNKGEVSLTLRLVHPQCDTDAEDSQDKPMLHFVVSDSGVGVSPDKQKEIFQAFQQEDSSTTRKFGGTGLGLSISQKLCRLLKGRITLTSKVGEGSTFTLILPVVSEVADEHLVEQPTIASPQKALTSEKAVSDDRDKIQPGRRLLLIVEDDVNFAKIVYRACRQQDAQAIIATSGAEAIALAKKYSFDGIVLDQMLPDIDGSQVRQLLDKQNLCQGVPIQIISALSDLQEGQKQGTLGHVVKPIDQQQLANVIHKLSFNPIKQRFLILEDDKIGSMALRTLLQMQDIEMDFAYTGNEALQLLEKNHYTAMILDLGLPDMSGFDVLRTLAGQQGYIPKVIVYTGKELTNQEFDELHTFTSSVVIKSPHSPTLLLEQVRSFVEEKVLNVPDKTPPESEPEPLPEAVVQPNASEEHKDKASSELTTHQPEHKDKIQDRTDTTGKVKKKTLLYPGLQPIPLLLVSTNMRQAIKLSKQLKHFGFEPHIAPSKVKVQDVLQRHNHLQLALLLVDDNGELAQEIVKDLLQAAAVRSIALINDDTDSSIWQQLGVIECVPITAEEDKLQQALQRLLKLADRPLS